jgi:ketosteroid isomerase-like protein
MSQENVEMIRESFDLFSADDLAEGVGALYAPDVILFPPAGWPEPGPFVGREAVIGEFTRLLEDWSSQRLAWIDATATGDWVIVKFEWHVRGSGSGIETRFDMSGAYRVDDGKVAEVRFYWEHDKALEATGLSE